MEEESKVNQSQYAKRQPASIPLSKDENGNNLTINGNRRIEQIDTMG